MMTVSALPQRANGEDSSWRIDIDTGTIRERETFPRAREIFSG